MKPPGKTREWTASDEIRFHKSRAFMDYLHGDVKPDEARTACQYEYARESSTLWKAARWRDELISKLWNGASGEPIPMNVGRAFLGAAHRFGLWLGFPPFCNFLCFCRSFPKRDWNELTAGERNALTRFLKTEQIGPLPMTDVWTLKATGVLDKFAEMADSVDPVVEVVPVGEIGHPVKMVPPLLKKHGSIYHAIFDLDFSRSAKHLRDQFVAWLALPEIRALLKQHKIQTVGKTGEPIDRLKDLAAWRLFRELANNWNKANDFANKHRKVNKAFHDARRSQAKTPLNQAPLASEESNFLKARTRAKTYLAEFMPEEFNTPAAPASK